MGKSLALPGAVPVKLIANAYKLDNDWIRGWVDMRTDQADGKCRLQFNAMKCSVIF